jgi:hypothetical protein
MNKKWITSSALLFIVGMLFAQTESTQVTSHQDALESFWKMETQGSRLTPEGWYKASEFFSGRPSPPPQERAISIVSSSCSVGTTSVNQKTAELYLFCSEFKILNSKLLLEDPPHNAPSGGPVLTGMWIPFKLVLSDKRWEFGPGIEPRETKDDAHWRIDGFLTRDFLNRFAAVNYVTERRDKSTDPAIKQNAEKTIAILKDLH